MPQTELPPLLYEQIQRRAYELYEQRGRQDGHHLEDWFQAQRELLGVAAAAPADLRVEVAPRSTTRRRSTSKASAGHTKEPAAAPVARRAGSLKPEARSRPGS